MIYLDSLVAFAHLLVEDRVPPAALWAEPLVSSRLLEYELWTAFTRGHLGGPHGDMVRALLGRVVIPTHLCPASDLDLSFGQALATACVGFVSQE